MVFAWLTIVPWLTLCAESIDRPDLEFSPARCAPCACDERPFWRESATDAWIDDLVPPDATYKALGPWGAGLPEIAIDAWYRRSVRAFSRRQVFQSELGLMFHMRWAFDFQHHTQPWRAQSFPASACQPCLDQGRG